MKLPMYVVSYLMFPSVTLERDKACLLSGAEAESVGRIVVRIIHLCVSVCGVGCLGPALLYQ